MITQITCLRYIPPYRYIWKKNTSWERKNINLGVCGISLRNSGFELMWGGTTIIVIEQQNTKLMNFMTERSKTSSDAGFAHKKVLSEGG